MAPSRGADVLRGRYGLFDGPLADLSNGASESWLGVQDIDQEPCLIKTWRFTGPHPDQFQRALWDAELRNLYRLGSSPGSEKSLLVLRDAGVDDGEGCFVMVLESSARGYELLDRTLAARMDHAWLSSGDPLSRRRELWGGLRQVADGLRLLHEQHILHRHVGASAVFCNVDVGPSSFRLGGFEWSLRLGVPATSAPTVTWATPPESILDTSRGYRPETDWFGFGMLAARCLLNLETYKDNQPQDRYQRVRRSIAKATARDLSEVERELILGLLAPDPSERLDRPFEIHAAIGDVLERLDRGLTPSDERKPLVLVVNPAPDRDLAAHAMDVGFVADPAAPQIPYNANDPVHVSRLTMFLQERLETASIYASGERSNLLVGEGLDPLRIGPYESYDVAAGSKSESWDLAFCYGLGELRHNRGGSECVELPPAKVVVRSTREAGRTRRTLSQTAEPWNAYLPVADTAEQLRESLAVFHEFISCANQIELLIRDSELFSYQVVDRTEPSPGVENIRISELERKRPPLDIFRLEGGLVEFLQREVESNKRNCRLVALTDIDEDSLVVRHVSEAECWSVTSIDTADGLVDLRRVSAGVPLPALEGIGTLRTWGMFGQVALIRRRKRAIDRLEGHSYLLRSLSAAGQVYMDTGVTTLPFRLSPEEVDAPKQAAIHDILRVRPIYALQGPPGTGKTTLVAHLLRQLLEDDPVAQILITAQAHGAVDVLREKVRQEAFADVPPDRQPLAIRLGRQDEDSESAEGSVPEVTLSMLEAAYGRLQHQKEESSPVVSEWMSVVKDMIGAIRSREADRLTPDFLELVKRGANLIYCTTSSGDLEDLAELSQSFDWAILEEAGKAHCFDLALPLQAGHRWLLIGDHRQLPPYRFEDYSVGIAELDRVVDALWELPDRAGGLRDTDWIRRWQTRSLESRAAFKEYAKRWLNTFERVFEHCSIAPGEDRLTIDEPVGGAAGMLSGQHRMHPRIGELISRAYYDNELVNMTTEDAVQPHGRAHPFVAPAGIAGVPIIWLDVPDAAFDVTAREHGPAVGKPRYTNPTEVAAVRWFLESLRPGNDEPDAPLELAVLSPYNQQVSLLNGQLASLELPVGLVRKQGLHRGARTQTRTAHTVDSFQGNQADVIVVSLVRNNDDPPGQGLGFLDQAQRLNVLLSRAERLLVVVGSWDFYLRQLSAVLERDRENTLWHWRKVLDTLSDWFVTGDALRLTAPQRGRR